MKLKDLKPSISQQSFDEAMKTVGDKRAERLNYHQVKATKVVKAKATKKSPTKRKTKVNMSAQDKLELLKTLGEL